MRNYCLLYINGAPHRVEGPWLFSTLANYLRYGLQLTGTKVVCEEGDCGSCTVLRAVYDSSQHKILKYQTINSCIAWVHQLDCTSLVTIEGLSKDHELNPIQQALAENHGSQCGFCTPGFIGSLTALYEDKDFVSEKDVKNYCTGNLCRCTGYKAIIDGALKVDRSKLVKIADRYHSESMLADFWEHSSTPIQHESFGKTFAAPVTLEGALALLAKSPPPKIIAGATDLGVLSNKGKLEVTGRLSLERIAELGLLDQQDQSLHVGALVTLDRLEQALDQTIPEFGRFLHLFASPQIKNTATLVGNIANASPIGDTMPPLLALDAMLVIVRLGHPPREVKLRDFYQGYKQMDIRPDELISKVIIPLSFAEKKPFFRIYKVSKRKDLDISAISAAILIEPEASSGAKNGRISKVRIAFGGVGPTPQRLVGLEDLLMNSLNLQTPSLNKKMLSPVLAAMINPLSDHRGSREFRLDLAANLIGRFLREFAAYRNPADEHAGEATHV